MDGLGQLYVTQNGAVYALVPPAERERERPPPVLSRGRPIEAIREDEVTQALLAQFLHRHHQQQQLQQREQELAQQQLAYQRRDFHAPAPGPHVHEDAIRQMLTATILQSMREPDDDFPQAGPATARMGPAVDIHASRRIDRLPPPQPVPVPQPAQSIDSPTNSESESPPASVRGSGRRDYGGEKVLGLTQSAKEKNRQAQRRFRERQKDLITNLKQRVEDLQKGC
ncbi:hypothetical protein Agub_g6218 [Astrephomene gubernaculifera]|uniref:BZIP domain-containing protein n=1 Tax=Astrephomene gubernaculifera TaxID=47775 RepID=A0AAD3DN18_9CHLO|nr:hypothetical protein Agub_g6218 [Astrephomene gubernaculifera]